MLMFWLRSAVDCCLVKVRVRHELVMVKHPTRNFSLLLSVAPLWTQAVVCPLSPVVKSSVQTACAFGCWSGCPQLMEFNAES